MKVIIIGCGKLGSGLALSLSKKGHSVTVVDSDAASFALLGDNQMVEVVVGVGFDRALLERVKVRAADAVVACTKSDEANALIGRLARNIYKVPHVISRLYDPRKAKIYRALGIQTISTTTWGVARVTEMLSYNQLDSVLTIGDGGVELVRLDAPALLVGKTVNSLTIIGEIYVTALTRGNKTVIPTRGTVIEAGDILYLTVMSSSMGRLKGLLGMG